MRTMAVLLLYSPRTGAAAGVAGLSGGPTLAPPPAPSS
jgi:hypothetical protein